jgi:hypothetical protein
MTDRCEHVNCDNNGFAFCYLDHPDSSETFLVWVCKQHIKEDGLDIVGI